MPTGGPILNQDGINHYDYEINALLAAGIEPYVCVFFFFFEFF